MTKVVMFIASRKLDLHNKLDNDMFNHITYVSNRVLMISKKKGLSKASLTEMGKYLWRLYLVLRAYSHKKEQKNITLEKIVGIVGDFRKVFGG